MDFDGWCTSLALVLQHRVVDSNSQAKKKTKAQKRRKQQQEEEADIYQ